MPNQRKRKIAIPIQNGRQIQDGRQNIHCNIDCLTFDIIALKSNVIPHFQLIWGYTDYVEITIFTFQGHPDVKTKMASIDRHEKPSFF